MLIKIDVLKQQGHYFDMNSAAYSPDGQLIITGSDDGKVKAWNSRTGYCFVTFDEHIAPVSAVAFSPKGYPLLILLITHFLFLFYYLYFFFIFFCLLINMKL